MNYLIIFTIIYNRKMEIISLDHQLYVLMAAVFFVAGINTRIIWHGFACHWHCFIISFIPPLEAIGLNIIPIFLVSFFQVFQTGNPIQ